MLLFIAVGGYLVSTAVQVVWDIGGGRILQNHHCMTTASSKSVESLILRESFPAMSNADMSWFRNFGGCILGTSQFPGQQISRFMREFWWKGLLKVDDEYTASLACREKQKVFSTTQNSGCYRSLGYWFGCRGRGDGRNDRIFKESQQNLRR